MKHVANELGIALSAAIAVATLVYLFEQFRYQQTGNLRSEEEAQQWKQIKAGLSAAAFLLTLAKRADVI